MKAWYCWGAALLVILSTSSSLATAVEGLALSSIKEKIKNYISSQKEQRSEEESKEDDVLKIGNDELVSKLAGFINSEAQIEEDVECKPLEPGDSCPQVSTSDEDEEVKIGRNIDITKSSYNTGVKSTNRSRKKDPSYDPNVHFVKPEDPIPDASSLVRDAKEIHESLDGDNYTTIFCVALRDGHGHIKKFAFHNSPDEMRPSRRKKLKDLGYDRIQSDQSHAEGQFLQFLFKREGLKEREETEKAAYTHIIAMGCSRPHCVECDCLFRLILGKNYSKLTAAAEPSGNPDVVTSNITANKFTLTKKRDYKILTGTAAVSKKGSSPKFFIPIGLKSIIEAYTKGPINLLGDKYGGSET